MLAKQMRTGNRVNKERNDVRGVKNCSKLIAIIAPRNLIC